MLRRFQDSRSCEILEERLPNLRAALLDQAGFGALASGLVLAVELLFLSKRVHSMLQVSCLVWMDHDGSYRCLYRCLLLSDQGRRTSFQSGSMEGSAPATRRRCAKERAHKRLGTWRGPTWTSRVASARGFCGQYVRKWLCRKAIQQLAATVLMLADSC